MVVEGDDENRKKGFKTIGSEMNVANQFTKKCLLLPLLVVSLILNFYTTLYPFIRESLVLFEK